MSFNVKLNDQSVRERLRSLKQVDKQNLLHELGFLIEAAVKSEITEQGLVKTGNYRASVHTRVLGNYGQVYSGAKYSIYLEKGTDPHIIRPKHKKALKFKGDGGTVFTKLVHHPGTKAYKPFQKALKKVAPELSKIVKNRVMGV